MQNRTNDYFSSLSAFRQTHIQSHVTLVTKMLLTNKETFATKWPGMVIGTSLKCVFKTAQFTGSLKDELPVDEGALSGRVVTHYHHNNLFPGRKQSDAECVGNLDQAWNKST